MARGPKCEACGRRVARVKGKCRPCYDKAYQEARRREAGIEPRELVGPASGGVKLEFWVPAKTAARLRAFAGWPDNGMSKILRRALDSELLRLSEETSEEIGGMPP